MIVVTISEPCTYVLRLEDYRNVVFRAKVDGVTLVSLLKGGHRANRFSGVVRFVGVEHVIERVTEPSPDDVDDFVVFNGDVVYEDGASLVTRETSVATRPSGGHGRQGEKLSPENVPHIPGILAASIQKPRYGRVVQGTTAWTRNMRVDLPTVDIGVGYVIDGIVDFEIDRMSIKSGIVFAGTGTLNLTRANPGATVFASSMPNMSCVTAMSGVQRINNLDLVVVKTASEATLVSARNNERPSAGVDEYRAFLFLNSALFASPLAHSNPILALDTNQPSPQSPITIRLGSINGTGLGFGGVSVATNDVSSVVYGVDFISSIPYEQLAAPPGTYGPMSATFGSSSLVWNGSTFIDPVVIRGDYEHTKLDGTYFHIAAGSALRVSREPSCRQITITLPSGSTRTPGGAPIFWTGRVVHYKRIDDTSSAGIAVVVKLNLEGQRRALTIEPNQSIHLHNVDGVYYVMGRVPRY